MSTSSSVRSPPAFPAECILAARRYELACTWLLSLATITRLAIALLFRDVILFFWAAVLAVPAGCILELI